MLNEDAVPQSLDPAILAELVALDDDGQFVARLFGTYFEEAGEALDELQNALQSMDARKLRRAAHYLAGASLSIGATAVAAACRTLELIAERGHWFPDPRHVDAIAHEVSRADSETRVLRSCVSC